jgi:Molybdopterin oxidoreductase Fe4S4 domain
MLNAATVRTTCPRDCYDAYGVLVKTATDGTVNVVGDPDHNISRGALCGKAAGPSTAVPAITSTPSIPARRLISPRAAPCTASMCRLSPPDTADA